MTTRTPPVDGPPEDGTVLMIADSRLDALRGQTMVVGDYVLAIPLDSGAFPVPVGAAQILVKQTGWRLAPGQVLPESGAVPQTAPVIPTPDRTHDQLGRLPTARVASPTPAEMRAQQRHYPSADVLVASNISEALTRSDSAPGAVVGVPIAADPVAVVEPPPAAIDGAENEMSQQPSDESTYSVAPACDPDPPLSFDTGGSSDSSISFDSGGSFSAD